MKSKLQFGSIKSGGQLEIGERKMPIGKERREYERFPCKAQILHSTNPTDFFYSATMYNFSKRGLYFESNEDLLKGHEISISIKKPPQQFLIKPRQHFDVKIMWCRVTEKSSYQLGYGAKIL